MQCIKMTLSLCDFHFNTMLFSCQYHTAYFLQKNSEINFISFSDSLIKVQKNFFQVTVMIPKQLIFYYITSGKVMQHKLSIFFHKILRILLAGY